MCDARPRETGEKGGRKKKGLPPLLLQVNSPSAQQREIPIGCCLVKLSSPKGVRALVFCCDYIINMAASCTNADVLATVIQKLGGLTLKDGQILALNSLLRGKDVFAVLPTGYKKSLNYQCNALSMLSWKSLVVPRSLSSVP